ncbi:hypothetical protein [Brasilonema bromeliae]|uniref:hypothetical protein n=1 Tax=Brasilonema bromeliae TaxID=383615 RepID=UPI00145D29E0|nr:hypothetical protein [Brasilonema bromeliae]
MSLVPLGAKSVGESVMRVSIAAIAQGAVAKPIADNGGQNENERSQFHKKLS